MPAFVFMVFCGKTHLSVKQTGLCGAVPPGVVVKCEESVCSKCCVCVCWVFQCKACAVNEDFRRMMVKCQHVLFQSLREIRDYLTRPLTNRNVSGERMQNLDRYARLELKLITGMGTFMDEKP